MQHTSSGSGPLDVFWEKRAAWIWWGVVALHLLVVWILPHFLTQDGSAHLYTASVFLQMWGENAPQLKEIFQFNQWMVPAWGGGLFLAALIAVFGVFGAEKILISCIIVLLAVGFKSLLKSFGIRNGLVPFLILPFLFNHLLMMGLYYFLLATGLSLLLLAWAYRSAFQGSVRYSVVLAMGFILVFYVHPLPPALAGLGLVFFALARGVSGKLRAEKRVAAKWLASICVAGMPAAVVAISYALHSSYDGPVAAGRGVVAVLQDLASVSMLVSFQMSPQWWTLCCGVVLLVIFLRVGIRLFCKYAWHKNDLWLGFSLLLILLMAVVPEGMTGGTLMSFRLGLIFWICGCVWVGSRIDVEEVRWMRHGVAILFIAASLIQVGSIYLKQREIQPFLKRLEAVSKTVPDHSRVWPVVENFQGEQSDGAAWSPRTPYLVHVGLRFLAAKKDVAAMISYQGEVSHFMVQFREPPPSQFFQQGFDVRPQQFSMPAAAVGFKLRVAGYHELVKEVRVAEDVKMTRFGVVELLPLP